MRKEQIERWLDSSASSREIFLDNSEIGSIAMSSSSSNSSSKLSLSFSNLPIEAVFKYICNTDYNSFLYKQTNDTNLLIPVQEAPQDLKKSIFSILNVLMANGKAFPSSDSDEGLVKFYFQLLVTQIKGYALNGKILKETSEHFKMDENEFKLINKVLNLPDSTKMPSGQCDLCFKDPFSNKVAMITEFKNGLVDSGFKQLALYLKTAFLRNGDGNPVFGAVTNVEDISFMKLDETGITVLYKINLLSPLMIDSKYEKKWISESKAVDILYTILCC